MEKEKFGESRIISTNYGDKLFKIWRKHGKNRLYIMRYDGKKTYGYIDLNNYKFFSLNGKFGEHFVFSMIKAIEIYDFTE